MYPLSLSFVLDISVLFYVERFPSCSPLPIGFLYLSRVRRKRRWDRLFPGYLFPSFSEIFFWSIGFHVFSWPFCYSFPYVITFSFSLRIKLNEHSQCVDIIWSTLFSGWIFDSFVTSEAQKDHAKKTRGAKLNSLYETHLLRWLYRCTRSDWSSVRCMSSAISRTENWMSLMKKHVRRKECSFSDNHLSTYTKKIILVNLSDWYRVVLVTLSQKWSCLQYSLSSNIIRRRHR